ncbi:hypothetical protein ON010_g13517 [Phytophthora cinnamomi]|nr:hypothetical protein ON010_g13517 [Phytophthora cinnamomi]
MAPPSQRLEEDFAAASAVPSRLFSASYFASELEKRTPSWRGRALYSPAADPAHMLERQPGSVCRTAI